MQPKIDVLYRYTEEQDTEFWGDDPQKASESMVLLLHVYPVIKETPCGVWILTGYMQKKFVNLKAMKKFAYETQEPAMAAFTSRKNRQVAILKYQLLRAQAALHLKSEDACKRYITF